MKKLRLLVTEYCPRKCPSCCNKDWDLGALPVVSSFKGYESIMLTGGEPMELPLETLLDIFQRIRRDNPGAKIYVYSAALHRTDRMVCIAAYVDGFTVTLHEKEDGSLFEYMERTLPLFRHLSLRLNVFRGVPYKASPRWIVKDNMVWQKNCPLPQDETFMRL
jgi:hypothetical protein